MAPRHGPVPAAQPRGGTELAAPCKAAVAAPALHGAQSDARGWDLGRGGDLGLGPGDLRLGLGAMGGDLGLGLGSGDGIWGWDLGL